MEPHELLEATVCAMVDDPDAVDIVYQLVGKTAVFEINVAYDDVAKVLGRRGSHADALRAVFGAIYGKHRKQLKLQVIDPRR
jgi:predicted RNA-binding protein YlqC (UPF0109 family)